jgi:hypothetical protein
LSFNWKIADFAQIEFQLSQNKQNSKGRSARIMRQLVCYGANDYFSLIAADVDYCACPEIVPRLPVIQRGVRRQRRELDRIGGG